MDPSGEFSEKYSADIKEARRLEAVSRYLGFKHDREKDLQDLVMLASFICDSPIAMVTLMDKDVQWIKAKVGGSKKMIMDAETSFCKYTVLQNEVLVVDDTSQDERFARFPSVVNTPNIRFYAGASLQTYEGDNVGTLCVYDVKPKSLTDVQKNCLEALSKQVSHLMALDMSMSLLTDQIKEVKEQKEKVNSQNLRLRKIAQIQSHEYRHPVSSIMGLMGLIKADDYAPNKEYLLLMEQAVTQLDEKINSVVLQSNQL